MYQETIRMILAQLGHIGKYDPRHVEAWMRLRFGVLDHLSHEDFVRETKLAMACIDEGGREMSEQLAGSEGIAR